MPSWRNNSFIVIDRQLNIFMCNYLQTKYFLLIHLIGVLGHRIIYHGPQYYGGMKEWMIMGQHHVENVNHIAAALWWKETG